jgi:site-specific DNA-methyltransferase (adenine-specific)
MADKKRAPRNRTLTLSEQEAALFRQRLITLTRQVSPEDIQGKTICQDLLEAAEFLPEGFVDLLFVDPPYNLSKSFGSTQFRQGSLEEYAEWVDSWLSRIVHVLKPDASIYVCGDWRSSPALYIVLQKYFIVRNRITWEREKGRGAKSNWKSCSEDIWFCTKGDDYYFNVGAVKLRRRVRAPYRDDSGEPKDWDETREGNYRLTHPSNLWTDLTVPFWAMPENTDHPTQKPEKLLAKVILASSRPGDFVFDPFLGSGTTSVVAKKLRRRFSGVEIDPTYCCYAEKRLALAERDPAIQGYSQGVFWERNTHAEQRRAEREGKTPEPRPVTFFAEPEK